MDDFAEDVRAADGWDDADSDLSEGGDMPSDGETVALRHLGEQVEVGRGELIALAQKGLDYDRVRGKLENLRSERDSAKRGEDFLRDLAGAGGMSVDELIDAENGGGALRLRGETDESARERRVKMARERGIRELLDSFPDLDPKNLGSDFWAEAKRGASLLNAYLKTENDRLRHELEDERRRRGNETSSTGSVADAGSRGQDEEFDSLWYSD